MTHQPLSITLLYLTTFIAINVTFSVYLLRQLVSQQQLMTLRTHFHLFRSQTHLFTYQKRKYLINGFDPKPTDVLHRLSISKHDAVGYRLDLYNPTATS